MKKHTALSIEILLQSDLQTKSRHIPNQKSQESTAKLVTKKIHGEIVPGSKAARIDDETGGEKDSWGSSARPSDEVMAQGLKVLTHRAGVNVVRPQVSEVLRVILTVLEKFMGLHHQR